MATKPGFMMYHGKVRVLAKMDAESFKAVMMAICDYSEFGAEPTALNDTEAMAFDMMREAIDRDNDKYLKRVEAGRKGGVASGEARRSIAKQNEANEPTQPNVNPTSTQHQPNPNTSLSPREGAGGEREIPLPEEVREYAERIGLEVDAEAFIRINRERGWRDSFGNPIRDWRVWLERSPQAKRKEATSERNDQPPVAGSHDEYGGRYL